MENSFRRIEFNASKQLIIKIRNSLKRIKFNVSTEF